MVRLKTLSIVFLLSMGLSAHTKEGILPAVSDPWLSSPNAAGLTRYAFGNMGMAELSLTKGKGGFVDFSGSPDALSVDASVASFFRLNSHAVVYGAMSYTNFSGRDMAGSAFIQSLPTASSLPVRYTATASQSSRHLPFDIVEDSLTNTGTKHQDTYRLTGALGYDLYKGFSLGARLDYTAANLAKYKDLRHKNKLMDLDLTAGFYLPLNIGDRASLGLGANYLYHRTTESLQFSTYGKNDKVYNSLVSYANFMGHLEQFGMNGYTDKSREMPLVSDYNGVGAQLNLQSSIFNYYNAFTYAHRRGYYGRRSPYTITYADHESDVYRYNAQLSLTSRHSRLALDLSLSAENLRNDATNYRELQNEQGATYNEYYTPVKTANKLWTDGTVALTVELGNLKPPLRGEVGGGSKPPLRGEVGGGSKPSLRGEVGGGLGLPLWLFRAGLNWHHREQTAYVYPFARRQDISSREPFVSLCRNIVAARKHAAYWTLALDFSFLKGSGQPFEDFTYQAPSDKQEQPPTMDAYLWREYTWLTAAQYHIGGSAAYSFILPGPRLRTFLRLSLSHRKANEGSIYSQGCDFTTATFAVGCTF